MDLTWLWVAIGVTLAVWLVAVGLLPEFLPVVGPLDDAIVAAAVPRHLVRRAGSEVVDEHWRGDPATIARVLRVFGVPAAPDPDGPRPT